MLKKQLSQFLSLLIVAALVVTGLPVNVLAETVTNTNGTSGTATEWNAIGVGTDNDPLNNVTIHAGISSASQIVEGETKLTQDITGVLSVTEGTYVIDLAGFTWSNSNLALIVNGMANVTIIDSVGGGMISVCSNDAINVIYGSLTLNGVTVKADGSGMDAMFVSAGNILVKNSTLIATKAGINASQSDRSATIVVDGGTFGIYEGAEDNTRSCAIEFRSDNKNVTLKGDIKFENNVIIRRNDCTKELADLITFGDESYASTFADTDKTLSLDGYTWSFSTIEYKYTASSVPTDKPTETPSEPTVISSASQIKAGETKLTQDITGELSVTEGTYVIDLAGFTWSNDNLALIVYGTANVTIIDSVGGGMISVYSSDAIYVYCGSLTLNGVTVKADGPEKDAMFVRAGNILVKNSTLIAPKAGIDASQSDTSATIVVDGGRFGLYKGLKNDACSCAIEFRSDNKNITLKGNIKFDNNIIIRSNDCTKALTQLITFGDESKDSIFTDTDKTYSNGSNTWRFSTIYYKYIAPGTPSEPTEEPTGISSLNQIVEGETKLINGIKGKLSVTEGTYVIDLAGFTWLNYDIALVVDGTANVTIIDSVGGGKISVYQNDAISVYGGSLTLNGVTIEADGSGMDAIFVRAGNILVKNSTLIASKAGIDASHSDTLATIVVDGGTFGVYEGSYDKTRSCAIEFRNDNKIITLKGDIKFENNVIIRRNDCTKELADLITFGDESKDSTITNTDKTYSNGSNTWRFSTIDYKYTAPGTPSEPTAEPTDSKSVLYVGYDEIRPGIICGGNNANIKTPVLEAGTTEATFWGWVALAKNVKSFSYSINGGVKVDQPSAVFETEQPVLDAAAGVAGAITASRFKVVVPVTDGTQKIEIFAEFEDGNSESFWVADLTVGEPTTEPTAVPTTEPTVEPTVQPTTEPTIEPTAQPTESVVYPCIQKSHDAYAISTITTPTGYYLQSVILDKTWVGIVFPGWTVHNDGTATFEVFAYNTDLTTSAAGTALLRETITIKGIAQNEHRLATSLPAGKYVFKISNLGGSAPHFGLGDKASNVETSIFVNEIAVSDPFDPEAHALIINYIVKGSSENKTDKLTPLSGSNVFVNSSNGTISGIAAQTTVSQAISKFEGSSYIRIVDKNGNVLAASALVGTGCKVQLVENGEVKDEVTVVIKGEVDGNGVINSDDVVYLLRNILFSDFYPVVVQDDIDGNGKYDSDDVVYLLRHILFPDMYPLK